MTFEPGDDLALETTIDELVGVSFVVGTATKGEGLLVRVPILGRPGARLPKLVEAWVRRGAVGIIRRTDHHPNTSVAAFALAHDLIATRAMIVPTVQWPTIGTPWVEWDGHRLDAEEVLARLVRPSGRRAQAVAAADEVRATYGRLLGDIGYRIECSALFDSSVALTRQFETAMALWQDVTDATNEAEVVRRSGMVRVTFAAARAHAETVGYAHLPEQARADAERAAKAARLAAVTASEAERTVALQQVGRILESLALSYLPDPIGIDRALTAE